LIEAYGSEENIVEGKTIDKEELAYRIKEAYEEGGDADAKKADTEDEIKQEMIAEDLNDFQMTLNDLKKKQGLVYYMTDGDNTHTNAEVTKRSEFEQYPV